MTDPALDGSVIMLPPRPSATVLKLAAYCPSKARLKICPPPSALAGPLPPEVCGIQGTAPGDRPNPRLRRSSPSPKSKPEMTPANSDSSESSCTKPAPEKIAPRSGPPPLSVSRVAALLVPSW